MVYSAPSARLNTVPLFPLADHVLLPGTPTPYRVFEARYRTMVEDLLAKPEDERWLAVPRLAAPSDLSLGADDTAIYPVASMALMSVATPLNGGDYLIVVEGLFPCRLEEIPSPGSPYRHAVAHPLLDQPEAARVSERAELIQATLSLIRALEDKSHDLFATRATSELDGAKLVFRIAHALIEDADARQALLDTRSPSLRRHKLLEQIATLYAFASRPPHTASLQ